MCRASLSSLDWRLKKFGVSLLMLLIGSAMVIECEEKVKAAMNIEPVEKQLESGHVDYAQAALITSEEIQKLSSDMFEENAILATQKEN